MHVLSNLNKNSNNGNFKKGGVKFHTCCGGAADTLPRGSGLAQVPLLPISGVPYQFPSPPGSKLFGMKVRNMLLNNLNTLYCI